MKHDYNQGVLDGLQSAYNAIKQSGNVEVLGDLIQEAYEHV